MKICSAAGDGIFAHDRLAGAVRDGYIDSGSPNHLFRESAELGYQLMPGINMSALLNTSPTPISAITWA